MWGIYEIEDCIHIVPIEDEGEHIFDKDCSCEPREEINNGIVTYVHDAFDGRIAVERANEILGNENT